ncbi:MAG: family N-acetyltransferase [Patescibacteria group bacterium]|nr:family N-acetyltransferase [Patescibacteria group bacterium]
MPEICITPLYPELAEEHRRLQRQMILTDPTLNSTLANELTSRLDGINPARLIAGAHHYIANVDNNITGGVTLRPGVENALISGLFVEEPYRRRGIASALMSHVLEVATQTGQRQATLWVADHNQVAYSWYLRLGFGSTEPPTLRLSSLGQDGFDELLVKPLGETPDA